MTTTLLSAARVPQFPPENGPPARFRGLEAEFSANAKMAPQCAVRVREIGCKN